MNDNKVLAIKGGKTDWYDQVIFITKDNYNIKRPVNLIVEAERIIQSYIAKGSSNLNTAINSNNKKIKYVKKDRTLDVVLNICLILSILLLSTAIYNFFT